MSIVCFIATLYIFILGGASSLVHSYFHSFHHLCLSELGVGEVKRSH